MKLEIVEARLLGTPATFLVAGTKEELEIFKLAVNNIKLGEEIFHTFPNGVEIRTTASEEAKVLEAYLNDEDQMVMTITDETNVEMVKGADGEDVLSINPVIFDDGVTWLEV